MCILGTSLALTELTWHAVQRFRFRILPQDETESKFAWIETNYFVVYGDLAKLIAGDRHDFFFVSSILVKDVPTGRTKFVCF
jgi:hypothetical protein